ncbi:hypothetical protein CDAR_113881 [Caerostris darwini]|uniref:Uncharacterized protein n=1 Tax=Caerostris darwini TaxID=1538125 RepID=A0AAV4STA4_9ARAC|nr:hypothetical protein CDAR_113881 [Caerostris darwini]
MYSHKALGRGFDSCTQFKLPRIIKANTVKIIVQDTMNALGPKIPSANRSADPAEILALLLLFGNSNKATFELSRVRDPIFICHCNRMIHY